MTFEQLGGQAAAMVQGESKTAIAPHVSFLSLNPSPHSSANLSFNLASKLASLGRCFSTSLNSGAYATKRSCVREAYARSCELVSSPASGEGLRVRAWERYARWRLNRER